MKKIIPFSYYGGKATICDEIVDMIPPGVKYFELFAGSLAVYFRAYFRKVIKGGVVNDLDENIYSFYSVLKDDPDFIIKNCNVIPHESTYRKTFQPMTIEASPKEKAKATFIHYNMSRSGGFRLGFSESQSSRVKRNISYLNQISNALYSAEILNMDASEIIDKNRRSTKALFYLDPPYVGSVQGYRHKCTKENMMQLLESIKSIKGKFILSHYFTWIKDIDDEFKKYNIKTIRTTAKAKTVKKGDKKNERTELLITNF
jgi:DNA adenine methylase